MRHLYCSALALTLLFAACDRSSRSGSSDLDEFVWPPPVPIAASDEDARCRALGETACLADPQCRVAFRSSECTPDFCTEDEAFHYCYVVQPGVIEAAEERATRCAETGGTWRPSNPVENSTCNCSSIAANTPLSDGPVYDTWLGCASYRELCTARGYEWRRIENVREVESYREMSASECVDEHQSTASYNADTRRCTRTFNGFTCFVDGAEMSNEDSLLRAPE